MSTNQAEVPVDDSYVSGRDQTSEVPVVSDNKTVESGVDGATADSDEQLGKHSLFP